MQNNPFLEKMQAHPDAKLQDIVTTKRGDYQPEAIAAAEYVLKERGVSFEVPPAQVEQKKKRNPVLAIAFGSLSLVVAIYLIGFLGTKTGIKPSYIILGSFALLCGIWFFFGILKGKK